MRSTSKSGLDIIKKHEGLRLNAYLCPASVVTIGYGNTRYPDGSKVKMGDKLDNEQEATSLLLAAMKSFEDAINRHLPNINQCQFDALVSFCYNVGTGAFIKSTLLKKAKANPADPSIVDEFNKWVRGGGKVLPGLVTRRREEAKLYFSLCK